MVGIFNESLPEIAMAIEVAQRLREVRRFLRVDLHEARAPVLLAKLPGGLDTGGDT